MPNYKVFQDVPASLRTRLYGSDGASDVAVVVNPAGVLAIQDNDSSLTVDATSLDIRALANATDSVLVYGFDGTTNRPLLIDATGKIQTIAVSSFVEATQTVDTSAAFVGSDGQDVSSTPNFSWFVKNVGGINSADVLLEVSPNNLDWVVDGAIKVVLAGTAIVIVPDVFLRYTRISYKSTLALADTTLTLIWQAHS